ncbi:MAG: hypothetical protein HDT48_02055 [Ruminococcaceae bacterium]|nr:hypothetical protein [Oscillospiraceae bacterium]
MNYNEIIKRLHEPFTAQEIEWKIQVTSQDKKRGMAVAYMDARAVQKRLDEVIGAFNWKNVYSLWHDNSQICGISIFNDDRNEWITKFDGAENSDIEPIKGGLSDSFKRAATIWGIGRYLYEIDGVWVEIEPKGKSFAIKQNQYGKLEGEYNNAVNRIFSIKPTQQTAPKTETFNNEYEVRSIKPSGKASQVLELVDTNGTAIKAYIKAADQSIKAGAKLTNVQIETKNSNYGDFNLISNYKLAA